jgi:hypothetical protein
MAAEAFTEESGTKLVDFLDGEKATGIGQVSNGDWTSYAALELGKGPVEFRVRVSAPKEGGKIVLRVNSSTGIVVGTIPVPATGGWDAFETLSIKLNKVKGRQTIYLCYTGRSDDLMKVNWFEWAPVK